jgi:hypothetical protein
MDVMLEAGSRKLEADEKKSASSSRSPASMGTIVALK